MAAEGLPVAGPAGGLPGWELEAWYQDLQEVLAAAEPVGPPAPWGVEQEGPAEMAPLWGTEGTGSVPEGCELDAALTAELQELLGQDSTAGMEPVQPPASTPCRNSPTPLGTEDDGVSLGHRAKRRRCSGIAANREQANEQRVLELTAHNEQLREEIRRLSAEVENMRAALIDRIVNLRQT